MSIQNEAETIITQQYLKMGIQKEVYDFGHSIAVSYTHLTLPTICSV